MFLLVLIKAAHCINPKSGTTGIVKLKPSDILALLGAHNLSNPNEPGKTSAIVSKIDIHDDWNPLAQKYDADIAMLTLEHQIQFTRFIKPICLWELETEPESTTGVVAGWGKSNTNSNHEEIPKQLQMPFHKNEHCFLDHSVLVDISSPRTFCGGSGDGTGVCNGDSGGGFLVLHQKRLYLKGIVSSSVTSFAGMCDVTKYAIFTNVFEYKNWIDSFINSDTFKHYTVLVGLHNELKNINEELKEMAMNFNYTATYQEQGN